ncbi:SMC-Scp complex subunit ScpB (plasmid) [Aliisedimentitalea scapharcae]|uniref:SMC-Scp complex subunit ScpB n=1 Tax=Aliisedimentitalea scapharcae TaxID=1524259 RepID=A0ABZ2XYC7_9RHOB
MARKKDTSDLDRELKDLPQAQRWREWMHRIEAVLFASATPVPRADLARVVGQGVSVDLLIDDIQADLVDRPYEVMAVGDSWSLRTRPKFGVVIRAAADVRDQSLDLSEFEVAVLGAIAYHQPLDRAGLQDIFGKDVSRDVISRLRQNELISTGPRSPRPGAPYTYVTTEKFLMMFDLKSLRDLPDREMLEDAGLVQKIG